ncbi:MAG: ABC transporter ATP-binding protein, partial [Solirubrobacteraceae bacterium]
DLPDVPAQERSLDGNRVLIMTTAPVPAVQRITTWALDRGLELEHFAVAQPSLEDIYLELTGSMREHDDATEAVR